MGFPVGFATHPGVAMSTWVSKSNAAFPDLHVVIGFVKIEAACPTVHPLEDYLVRVLVP